jgi:plasmid stabilization system protein ParE
MSYQLVIPPEIEQEIAEAFDAFDSPDRAVAFIRDLDTLFERIVDRPLQFPIIYAAMHRALLRHHDFSVFFEIDAPRSRVLIQAVLHRAAIRRCGRDDYLAA